VGLTGGYAGVDYGGLDGEEFRGRYRMRIQEISKWILPRGRFRKEEINGGFSEDPGEY